jgi:hypothetical protein
MNRALMEFYDNCLISLNMPHEWPPRSCDLTPCDFFCGHTLKIQFSVHLQLTNSKKSIIRRGYCKMLLTSLKEELGYAWMKVVVT